MYHCINEKTQLKKKLEWKCPVWADNIAPRRHGNWLKIPVPSASYPHGSVTRQPEKLPEEYRPLLLLYSNCKWHYTPWTQDAEVGNELEASSLVPSYHRTERYKAGFWERGVFKSLLVVNTVLQFWPNRPDVPVSATVSRTLWGQST